MNYYLLLTYFGFIFPVNADVCETPKVEKIRNEKAYYAPVIYLKPEHLEMVTLAKTVGSVTEKEPDPQVFIISE